jgi:ribosomal protein S18 acetylase RimI-like enzyme
MTDPALIHHIEELSMNAFPPLHSIHDDGWVLHFGAGYARRTNAVYPLYAGSKPLEEKIANCEALYRAQGLPAMFKLTKASIPPTLDDALAAKGYTATTHTAIQLLALGGWFGHADGAVTLSETATEAWLAAFGRMREMSEKDQRIHTQILRNILPERRFASITIDGEIVACGLGVLQNGYVGFYDIRTDAAFRRQRLSFRLMQTLLVWAKTQGATHAYLQVMLNNPPALALYEKLGFRQLYEYWYRVQPG